MSFFEMLPGIAALAISAGSLAMTYLLKPPAPRAMGERRVASGDDHDSDFLPLVRGPFAQDLKTDFEHHRGIVINPADLQPLVRFGFDNKVKTDQS